MGEGSTGQGQELIFSFIWKANSGNASSSVLNSF